MQNEIHLPDWHTLSERLLVVDRDLDLQKRFYPVLLQHARKKRHGYSILTILLTAIQTYMADQPPITTTVMMMMAPQFVEALVPNSEYASIIKEALRDMLGKSTPSNPTA